MTDCNDNVDVNTTVSDDDDEEKIFEPSKVLTSKLTSVIWKFFVFKGTKNKGPKKDEVFCSICLKDNTAKKKSVPYSNSTSGPMFHLVHHHKSELEKVKAEIAAKEGSKHPHGQNLITEYGLRKNVRNCWPKSSQKWKNNTKLLAKWLVAESRPLKMVEDKGFRDYSFSLCPEYDVPSRFTISNYIEEMYEVEKEKLISELKKVKWVSITTDGGSSTNAVSYIDVICHFIDENWELKSTTLCVKQNKEEHTAVKYREIVDNVLEEFEIDPLKVVCFVTDNENKMTCAFCDGERSGCCAHMFHSTVSHGSKKVKIVKEVIEKIRKVTKYHNKSPKFRHGFEKQQQLAGLKVRPLIQDVVNRWGSTAAATKSLLNHDDEDKDKPRFANMKAVNSALKIIREKEKTKKKKEKLKKLMYTEEEMVVIENLNGFFKKLDIFATNLGGSQYVTSSIVIPTLKSLKNLFAPNSNDATYIAEMKSLMFEDIKERMKKNLNFSIMSKSTVLDPRFKDLKMIEKFQRKAVYESIEMELFLLNDASKARETNDGSDSEDVEPVSKKAKVCFDYYESDDEDIEDVFDDEAKKEMERYKRESKVDAESCPLTWWKMHESSYKLLSQVAKKYLCVPATSVEAERQFSELGILLNKRRLLLTGSHVNQQLFLKGKVK